MTVRPTTWRGPPFAAPAGDFDVPALRRDAGSIAGAALAAVEPERLVRQALVAADPFPDARSIIVLAAGKAAVPMARAALERLGGLVLRAVIVAPETGAVSAGIAPPPGRGAGGGAAIELYAGGHPEPTEASIRGGRALLGAARAVGPGAAVLGLVSGGASALAAVPVAPITLDDLRRTTRLLLRAGATIDELNVVRRHLDAIKGGRLAAAAAPAPTLALLLSDVIGDRSDVIASGPFSPDATTYADALAVLRRYRLLAEAPLRVRRHLEAGARGETAETPKPGDPCFQRVDVRVLAGGATAAVAAAAAARTLGYDAAVVDTAVSGEARVEGRAFGERLREAARGGRRVARIACGETTVHVTGCGVGGRNLEFALGAARALNGADDVLVAALGTDGIDGASPAAGAIATGTTLTRARALGLDADSLLADNDAGTLFASLGDAIVTGPTGTNVMDLMIGLAGRARA
jgi:glycerate 2-kinase